MGMASLGAQELTSSADCKMHGCTNAAVETRGVYAFLCEEHRAVAARRQTRKTRSGLARIGRRDGSIAGPCRELVRKAERLERALDQVEEARDVATDAINDFAYTLAELRDTAQREIAKTPGV